MKNDIEEWYWKGRNNLKEINGLTGKLIKCSTCLYFHFFNYSIVLLFLSSIHFQLFWLFNVFAVFIFKNSCCWLNRFGKVQKYHHWRSLSVINVLSYKKKSTLSSLYILQIPCSILLNLCLGLLLKITTQICFNFRDYFSLNISGSSSLF